MGRMTRAKAAEVAERLHIDEDAVTKFKSDALSPAPDHVDRAPLGEISPNSVGSTREEGQDDGDKSSHVVAQAQNTNDSEGRITNEAQKDTDEHCNETDARIRSPKQLLHDVLPDENEAAHSPASRAASDDLMRDVPELPPSYLPVRDIEQKTPDSRAVGQARKQLRFDNEGRARSKERMFGVIDQDPFVRGPVPVCGSAVAKSASHYLPDTEEPFEGFAERPEIPSVLQNSPSMASSYQTLPSADNADEVGKEQFERRKKDAPYDKLEKAVVDASTPPKSSLKFPRIPAPAPAFDTLEAAALQTSIQSTPSRTSSIDMIQDQDDPIDALDALEDAVEKINAAVPEVQVSPEKKAKKTPLVRTTKASQARISLAHGPKDNRRTSAIGKPRQSLAASQNASKRVTTVSSTESAQNATTGESDGKKDVIIPHSKPRPMSMQFKPPPPPAKSTKAPTTSTFQLPGEAVAAKLKAAKEARMQKEAEERNKKTFKARPAPSMNKTPAVRQTSTSKARESLMSGKHLSSSIGPRRPSSASTSLPMTTNRPSIALKSTATSAKTASISKPTTSRNSIAAPSPSKSLSISKRPSSVMGTLTNKPRASLASRPTTTGTTSSAKATSSSTPSVQPSGSAKEKAVFNRVSLAKSQEGKAKQEREAAAKKARAEAAERSRLLSREWAEKQKTKKAGVNLAAQCTVVKVNGETAVDVAETF